MHGPGTRPGALVEWAYDRGHAADVRNLHRGDPLPELHEFDWLISTGGPMNCHQDKEYPFLATETKLLKKAIEHDKAVLGLCLGAQLMARSQGAAIRRNDQWEVGWHKVSLDDPWLGKGDLMAFHWHQDTFELPEGAKRIATNFTTANQAFRLSRKVLGLQFHPEATHEWVRECSDDPEYPEGPFVQSREDLVQGLIHQPAMNYWLRRLLQQIEGEL